MLLLQKKLIINLGKIFMNYDVTLCITTYNEEKYLPILLDSIYKQKTNLNIETIIIDDSSTDNTLKIAQNYDNLIRGG